MVDKWLERVVEAMTRLGGQGTLSEIYEEVRDIAGDSLSDLTDWDAIVRRTIQENASETKSYRGKQDLFYSVEGLGKGIWGFKENSEDMSIILSDDEEEFFLEGKKIARTHRSRERSKSLRKKKIVDYKKKNDGRCPCEVCGDDYSEIFGLENSLIDAHHLIPLSETSENRKTELSELAMVCPTCHRALHMSSDCSDLEALRKKIREYRTQ